MNKKNNKRKPKETPTYTVLNNILNQDLSINVNMKSVNYSIFETLVKISQSKKKTTTTTITTEFMDSDRSFIRRSVTNI